MKALCTNSKHRRQKGHSLQGGGRLCGCYIHFSKVAIGLTKIDKSVTLMQSHQKSRTTS